MYRLIDKYAGLHRGAGNMLVVRDGTNRLFGVYLNENIQKREGTYYGSGESCVLLLHDRTRLMSSGSCTKSRPALRLSRLFVGPAVINTMPCASLDSHLSGEGESAFFLFARMRR